MLNGDAEVQLVIATIIDDAGPIEWSGTALQIQSNNLSVEHIVMAKAEHWSGLRLWTDSGSILLNYLKLNMQIIGSTLIDFCIGLDRFEDEMVLVIIFLFLSEMFIFFYFL